MTKAALRRQERERQAREEAAAQNAPEPISAVQHDDNDIAQEPRSSQIPHMEPPPPYDAPHLPRGSNSPNRNSRAYDSKDEGGCMNAGPGATTGCMNFNSGSRGDDFRVDGCMNYDSNGGCMNYNSEGGCMNYESKDGCMNYYSHDGCMNYEVHEGGGCMNFRSNRGGCMQFGGRR